MYRVKNLSPGRVQIRSAGRSTAGGASEIVDGISVKLVRLREAGLIEWEEVGLDLKPKPADAPAPVAAAVEAVEEVVEAAVEAVEEVVEVAVEAVEEIAPPAATAEPVSFEDIDKVGEEPTEGEPAEAVAETEEVTEEAAVETEEAAEEVEEEPAALDPRVEAEVARLEGASWADIKAEAKDKGVSGRSRKVIVDGLVDLFKSGLE